MITDILITIYMVGFFITLFYRQDLTINKKGYDEKKILLYIFIFWWFIIFTKKEES